jgi:hypothetical protein
LARGDLTVGVRTASGRRRLVAPPVAGIRAELLRLQERDEAYRNRLRRVLLEQPPIADPIVAALRAGKAVDVPANLAGIALTKLGRGDLAPRTYRIDTVRLAEDGSLTT